MVGRPIQVDVRPHYLSLLRYYTESHRMAIIRAGVGRYEVLETPKRFEIGERWVLGYESALMVYSIESLDDSGLMKVRHFGQTTEQVIFRAS